MTVEPIIAFARSRLAAGGSRRGLTFLEVVAAAAMLGMLAAVVFGGFSSMLSAQERQQRRLACMELANRLVLQFIDDPTAMPATSSPIMYAGTQYRWDMTREAIQFEHAMQEVAAERSASATLRLDRLQNVFVSVWLGEESGGSRAFDANVAHASLSRLVDPVGMRNPDSLENVFRNRDGEAYRRWWDELNKASTGARGGSPSPTPSPPRPPPPASGGGRR